MNSEIKCPKCGNDKDIKEVGYEGQEASNGVDYGDSSSEVLQCPKCKHTWVN